MTTKTVPVIHRVTTLDLSLLPWSWPFADERRAEIDAHSSCEQREKPKLWNGRILLARNPVFTESHFRADYCETDFAFFSTLRDRNLPERRVCSGLASDAL